MRGAKEMTLRHCYTLIVGLTLAMGAALASAADFKIGFIDPERINRESAPAERASKQLEKEFAPRAQELQRREGQIKTSPRGSRPLARVGLSATSWPDPGTTLGAWHEERRLAPEEESPANENVVALAPILANVVCSSIYACNDFATAFDSIFKIPEPLIDGYNVFLRAPHTPSLGNAQLILQGKSPWRSLAEQPAPPP